MGVEGRFDDTAAAPDQCLLSGDGAVRVGWRKGAAVDTTLSHFTVQAFDATTYLPATAEVVVDGHTGEGLCPGVCTQNVFNGQPEPCLPTRRASTRTTRGTMAASAAMPAARASCAASAASRTRPARCTRRARRPTPLSSMCSPTPRARAFASSSARSTARGCAQSARSSASSTARRRRPAMSWCRAGSPLAPTATRTTWRRLSRCASTALLTCTRASRRSNTRCSCAT